MINVLLVDDHASVRKSLRYLLETAEDIKVVGTASSGFEALARVALHCPDVAIVDISMPLMDGIETTRLLRMRCGYTRVIMLSIYDNPEYVQRSIEVGAVGYVLKDTIGIDLLAAIRVLNMGGKYFSEKIAAVAEQYFNKKTGHQNPRGLDS